MKLKKRRDPDTFDLQIVVLGHKLGGKVWLTQRKEGGWQVHTSGKVSEARATACVNEVLKEHGLPPAAPWARISKVAEW